MGSMLSDDRNNTKLCMVKFTIDGGIKMDTKCVLCNTREMAAQGTFGSPKTNLLCHTCDKQHEVVIRYKQ